MSRMNKEELIKLIETIKADKSEFWLLSSSMLVLRNLYPDAGDLDIAVTNKGFEQLNKSYNLISKGTGFYTVADNIECICDCEIETLKYKPDIIEGYQVQNIFEYYEYLKSSKREKDISKIPLVRNYINKIETENNTKNHQGYIKTRQF